jgi:hypothetical protein
MAISDWLSDLFGVTTPSTIEIVFMACAVLGAAFFIIMMLLMLVGDIFGGVVDTAFDTDFSMDADLAFELFSLQGISAAVMMFGLMGMFSISATDNEVLSVLAGGAASVGSMYGVRLMMKGIYSLQADGTMNIQDAIGARGQVYSRIKPNETGEVIIPLAGSQRTMKARAKDKSLFIPTGEFIVVLDAIGSTVIVEPMTEDDEPLIEEEE